MAGSSITRIFSMVRSIINFAASEEGVQLTNPFGRVYYDRTAGVNDRQPIPVQATRVVQTECYRLDDEMRWLVAVVADTGMRLAEAAGLLREDFIRSDTGAVAVQIKPHPWRRLKTGGSTRVIPLTSSARYRMRKVNPLHRYVQQRPHEQTRASALIVELVRAENP